MVTLPTHRSGSWTWTACSRLHDQNYTSELLTLYLVPHNYFIAVNTHLRNLSIQTQDQCCIGHALRTIKIINGQEIQKQ